MRSILPCSGPVATHIAVGTHAHEPASDGAPDGLDTIAGLEVREFA
jgi:hypothetical protein